LPIKKLELGLALFYEVAIYQIIPRGKNKYDIIEIQILMIENLISFYFIHLKP